MSLERELFLESRGETSCGIYAATEQEKELARRNDPGLIESEQWG